MKYIYLLLMSIQLVSTAQSQETIALYSGAIPNSKPVENKESSAINSDGVLIISHVSIPTLRIFRPPADQANGAAVIICPGGGYSVLAAGHEGYDVAEAFNKMGVTAFVLKYRIPDSADMINPEIGPLQDAQRAIQLARLHAKEWHIDPNRIGIMGFSAGGHLASTAGTHFSKSTIDNSEQVNLRPDFMILIYPVISFTDSIGHSGSRNNLIGKNPSPEKIKEYSNELQITAATPPAFLVHARDDDAVPVKNSIYFYEALKKNHVPAEIYLFEKGGHGFGMVNKTSDVKWMDHVATWMSKSGWLNKKPA